MLLGMTAQPLVASAWGASETLPSLDPASLYVLALLQLTHVPARVAAPSTFHADAIPSLYGPGDTTLATSPAGVRTYLQENGHLDEALHGALMHARAFAIHSLLDDQLSDLVLHSLFSLPPNFKAVTAPVFAGPHRVLPTSLPLRLRAAVRARLKSPHIALWGEGGSWEREEAAEAQRWNRTAGLAAARDPAAHIPRSGFAGHPNLASDVREKWERTRISNHARRVFFALSAALEGDFFVGALSPTSVDARSYSLLAPMLYSRLPIPLLADLLKNEFPALVAHTDRMHAHLWERDAQWAWHHDFRLGPTVPTLTGLWTDFRRQWLSPSTWRSTAKPSAPLPPTLRWGRLAWMLSALIGPFVYVFLTGLVTIEYVDEDEENEEDEEDEEDDEDEENEDGEAYEDEVGEEDGNIEVLQDTATEFNAVDMDDFDDDD